MSRDFAYNKNDFPVGVVHVPSVSDVAVVERDVDGEATLIAAIDGAAESLRVFDVSGTEITLPVALGAGSAPDDIAVTNDFMWIYVSLPGANVIQEIEVTRPDPSLPPIFTKTQQLEPLGGFAGTLKGLAVDNAGKLYVCEDLSGAGDRVVKFAIPSSGTLLAWEAETTNVDGPVDVTVDEAGGVVAVLDFGGSDDPKGQLKLFDMALVATGDVLNSLHDPRDVVTEEPGVYVVAEKATVTNGDQTGEIRLFTQTIPGTSKKIIRGQFGASGVDILGNHGNLPGSTCIGGVCPGKRYVVSDIEIGKVFKLEKPVTLITGVSPNDAVTVGSGLDQQVWVCSGEPGLFIDDGTTNRIDVFRTVDDSELEQSFPDVPIGQEVPINCAASSPVGESAFAPTSMAVAESSTFKKIFVTMFDSGEILVYDGNTFTPIGLPILVGAGPRRIVIQPEIVE